jgi:hypothetical protein
VSSDQIYKDTLKALRDRRHFYRESLEHALSRRLEVWEKRDVRPAEPPLVPPVTGLAQTRHQPGPDLLGVGEAFGDALRHALEEPVLSDGVPPART